MKKFLFFAAITPLIGMASLARANDLVKFGDIFKNVSPAFAVVEELSTDGTFYCAAGAVVSSYANAELKTRIAEPRPNGHDNRGMPSGHSQSAAFGLGCYVGRNGWDATAVALAVGTALTVVSRVESEAHTIEQALVGAGLGLGFGYYSGVARDRKRNLMVASDGVTTEVGVTISARNAPATSAAYPSGGRGSTNFELDLLTPDASAALAGRERLSDSFAVIDRMAGKGGDISFSF